MNRISTLTESKIKDLKRRGYSAQQIIDNVISCVQWDFRSWIRHVWKTCDEPKPNKYGFYECSREEF
jgi:hypothetical protein